MFSAFAATDFISSLDLERRLVRHEPQYRLRFEHPLAAHRIHHQSGLCGRDAHASEAARTSMSRTPLRCTPLAARSSVGIFAMTAKGAGRREFAKLVTDHLLGHEDRHMLPAIMDRDRVPNHVREDGAGARPGANHACARSPCSAPRSSRCSLASIYGPFFDDLTT